MKLQVLKNQSGARRLVDAWETSCSTGAGTRFEVSSFRVIASWYAVNQRYSQALHALECALEQYPFCLDVYLLKILLLTDDTTENRLSVLWDTLQCAQGHADEALQAILFRVEAYCRREQYEQARALLFNLQKPLPEPPLHREEWAQRLQELGGQTIRLYTAALREPGNPEHFRKLWLSIELSGKYREGRTLHVALLEQHPYCCYAWHNLGLIYLHRKQWKKALDAFEYAYICNPYFEEAYLEYGDLSFERGMCQKALRCYEEMATHLDADSLLLVRIGECYRMLGQHSLAREWYQRALQLDPHDAEACFRLGLSFAAELNHTRAVRWLQDAVQRMPERDDCHLSLAKALAQSGNREKAARHYWKAVEIAPENADSWLALACFLFQNNEAQLACEALEIALENTCSAELQYALSACLFQTGQRAQALENLKNAFRRDQAAHVLLFQWMPALRLDREVMQAIQVKA